jgi:bromodomain-containing protein 8
MVQRQLDEDLAIPDSSHASDSLPRVTTPSTHEGDILPSTDLRLSPAPSPVGTDYVDEHIDLPGSPPPPHESPDPLDIITPAEEDSERDPSPTPEPPEDIQPSSPSQPFESSDGAVSAEPERSSISEPPETAEVNEDQLLEVEPLEVVERSEAEDEIESDEPAAVSNSDPVEGETSLEDKSDMVGVSIRPISEPSVVHAMGSPLPLGGTTTSVECKIGARKTEPEGGFGTLLLSTAKLHLAEAIEMVEVKEEIPLDESQPEETQVTTDGNMEIEQEKGHEAASPVAEQSRRDRKPWKIIPVFHADYHPDKRKVSEAASIFSDSARDRKKTREDSQPVDEDEPGMFLTLRITVSHDTNRSHAPTSPVGRPNVQEIPNGHHHGSFADFPASQWQHLPQPHQNI